MLAGQGSETLLNPSFPPVPALRASEHRLLDGRAEAIAPLLNPAFHPVPALRASEHRLLDGRAEAIGPVNGVSVSLPMGSGGGCSRGLHQVMRALELTDIVYISGPPRGRGIARSLTLPSNSRRPASPWSPARTGSRPRSADRSTPDDERFTPLAKRQR